VAELLGEVLALPAAQQQALLTALQAVLTPLERTPHEGDEPLPQQILQLVASQPGKVFNAEQIHQAIAPDTKIQTIRGALSRLARQKKIAHPRQGRYRALPG